MDDSLLSSSEDIDDKAQTYIRTLKQCAANFAVMYENMEAGLMYGKTVTGLDDADEISRLSDEYKNHAYYFGTRAMEIHFNVTNEADYTAINEEIWLIQDEINKINSNEKFLELKKQYRDAIAQQLKDEKQSRMSLIKEARPKLYKSQYGTTETVIEKGKKTTKTSIKKS